MVYSALLIAAAIGFAALGVDFGYFYSVQRELQHSADSAALAGASGMPQAVGGQPEARRRAKQFAQENKAGQVAINLPDADISFREYNWLTKVFLASAVKANSVTVTTSRTGASNGMVQSLFGRVLGLNEVGLTKQASAAVEPPLVSLLIDTREPEPEAQACDPLDDPATGKDYELGPGCNDGGCNKTPCFCVNVNDWSDQVAPTTQDVCPDCMKLPEVRFFVESRVLNEFDRLDDRYRQGGYTVFGSPVVRQALTPNMSLLRRTLDLEFPYYERETDRTRILTSLKAAINQAVDAPAGGRNVIIVFNADMGGPEDATGDLLDEARRAQSLGVRIYTLLIGNGAAVNTRRGGAVDERDIIRLLTQIATITNGQFKNRPQISDVRTIMTEIGSNLPVRLVE